jgi:hypothetical protein
VCMSLNIHIVSRWQGRRWERAGSKRQMAGRWEKQYSGFRMKSLCFLPNSDCLLPVPCPFTSHARVLRAASAWLVSGRAWQCYWFDADGTPGILGTRV